MILPPMILVIDNYDSFTWNLVHLIGGLGKEVRVVRNDEITAADALGAGAQALVLSPGPSTPKDAGICMEVVRGAVASKTPLFGVCLGLQSTAEALGGAVVRAGRLMHGKTSRIRHDGIGLFQDVPDEFEATRYHSLVAEAASLPPDLRVTARSADDGEIMALAHVSAPIAGVQFHPESIASEFGLKILENFFALADSR